MQKRIKACVRVSILVFCMASSVHAGELRALLISSYHPAFPTFFQQIDGVESVPAPAGVGLDVEFMDSKRFHAPEHVAGFRDALERFSIDPDLPPFGSRIVNERVSFFSRYMTEFLAVLAVFAVLCTSVVLMAVNIAKRRRVEAALRRREQRHGLLFNRGGDAVFVCGMGLTGAGVFTEVNDAACSRLGYTREELLRLTPDDINDPESEVDSRSVASELFAGGRSLFETRLVSKYGEMIPVEVSASLFKDEGGRYVLSITRDVARRARAEEKLRQLTRAVEQGPTAVIITDTGGNIEYVNAKFTEMTGYESGEAVGRNPGMLKSGRTTREEYREIWRTILSGNDWEGEFLNRRKDGSMYWEKSFISPVRDPRGRITHFIAMKEDITATKELRDKLMESEKTLRTVVEHAGVAISVVQDGKRVFFNSRFAELLGYTPEEFRALPLEAVYPPRERGTIRERIDGVLKESADALVQRRHKLLTKDGDARWVEALGKKITWKGRPALHIFLLDATEQVLGEEALRRARDQAEAANRAKSEFLANMSHELRTPLNGVMGMLQLMKITPDELEREGYVDVALKSCNRLTQLLSNILDLSAIESGVVRMKRAPLSLADAFSSLEDLFWLPAREAGNILSMHIDPRIPADLVGDAYQLDRMLINLVGNAVKYTASGAVRVEAWRMPPDEPGRVRVLFIVSDTGIGIPDEMLDHVLESFTQAEQSFVRTYQGAGLGLSMVKRAAVLLNGTIAVDSEVGRGTDFYLCLTFETEDVEAHRAVLESARPHPARPLRVLVVEDDAVSRISLAKILRNMGCSEPLQAEHGQAALEVLRKEEVDLILMDIRMPVLDGVAATRRIRTDADFNRQADVPIVALTAHAMAGDKEAFLDAGMDDYLPKPMDIRALGNVLDRLAERGRVKARFNAGSSGHEPSAGPLQ